MTPVLGHGFCGAAFVSEPLQRNALALLSAVPRNEAVILDTMQPCAQIRAVFELVRVRNGARHGVIDEVVGIEFVAAEGASATT